MRKRRYKNIIFIFFPLLLVWLMPVQAQDEMPSILPGPDGAVVFLLGAFVESISEPVDPAEKIVIYRQSSQEKYKKIGETGFPKSAAEMGKKLGDLVDNLHHEFNTTSEAQLYSVLTTLPLDSMGILFTDYDISKALGFIYFDESFKAGQSYDYRIERQDRSKNIITEFNAVTEGVLPEYPGYLQLKESYVTDSVTLATWAMPNNDEGLRSLFVYSDVYRQTDAGFEAYKRIRLSENENRDTVLVSLSDELEPGKTYAYYLQIRDWAGNKGVPSDTLFALAYDRHNLRSVEELLATPQDESIILRWKALPSEAVYTGIEIQKSRNYDSAYVVLDTIPSTAVEFLDTRVLKGSTYHYRVRPLYMLQTDEPIIYSETSATIAYTENNPVPQAPQGVAANSTDKGIQISWWTSDELDIFGYYVLRGMSKDNMEIASGLIEDIRYIDTLVTPGYSGQILYAVQAVNYNQQLGDTSDIVVVDVRQRAYVTAPAGLSARKVGEGVSLSWNNVKEVDDNVMAYAVFRKEAGEGHEFTVIHEQPLTFPDYIDPTYDREKSYEYAVASIDAWGNFSNLSPIARLDLTEEYELTPPLEIRLRNLGSGIEVSWPISLTSKKGMYAIYRKEEGKSEFVKAGEVPNTDVFVDRNVEKGKAYEYRVMSLWNGKESEPSISRELRR